MDRTIYVYCVVARTGRIGMRGMPEGLPGGSRPMLLPLAGRFFLVASHVPRETYAPEAIEPRLRDLDWVSTIAFAHEAVVERMMRLPGATVVPMTLFTLFSGPDRAVAELRKNHRDLERIVREIAGADEWGIRVTRGAGPPARPVGPAPYSSGTSFLAARKQARDEVREQSVRMREAAADTLRRLRQVAKGTATHSPPRGAASPPLLDAAFLVPRRRAAHFRAAVRQAARRCQEAGADLTLTGPWPAYNFIGRGDRS